MMSHSNHSFHLVNYSPWPLIGALSTMTLLSSLIKWFHNFSSFHLLFSLLIVLMTSYQWWRDISRESTFQGIHSHSVSNNMRWGMILFIISEIFFFISFFWTFLHSSLSPNIEIGSNWPPMNITPFNPFQIPLLNSLILISSGVSVTWSHHSILCNNHTQMIFSLLLTIILGVYFSLLQLYEYIMAPFSMSDSIYGSTFFIATGFHGLHVIIGTIFLTVNLMRQLNNHFSSFHHFGFEAAAWYWHFVDVVWLILFILIYWWGN
uniref:cytochrome c oxidase subunit III n=1 Tax=Gunungiella wangi TaxID=3025506 RepID=UPI002434DEE3|nr:cytochrome c oxidase subunit III [Gunungiella wangi]WEU80068.1 cytochrome c oxidase subunit III [Gunungiella wangi]